MRLRTVSSSVPGGVSFFGFVRSQYHLGHSTGGGLGCFGAEPSRLVLRLGVAEDVDVQSSCCNHGSFFIRAGSVFSKMFFASSRTRSAVSPGVSLLDRAIASATSLARICPLLR